MKVLYATDGLEPSIEAGRLLEKIGDRKRIEVTVLSVTHAGVPAPEHAPLMLDPLPLRRKDTLSIVDAAVEKLIAGGFKATGRTAEGHPGQEIVQILEQDWYDLVVLGAGGRSWLGTRLLGSVSNYVLHSSPWSVLIVHEGPAAVSKARALVGADGSRGAEFTIGALARVADPAALEIIVLSVAPDYSPTLFAVPGALYIPPEAHEQDEQVAKQLRERAERHADSAATQLRDAGFDATARVVTGHPAEQLLKEADGGQFDLVVVGSRGQGPFRRALLGSVSDHVVRHSRAALVGRRLET